MRKGPEAENQNRPEKKGDPGDRDTGRSTHHEHADPTKQADRNAKQGATKLCKTEWFARRWRKLKALAKSSLKTSRTRDAQRPTAVISRQERTPRAPLFRHSSNLQEPLSRAPAHTAENFYSTLPPKNSASLPPTESREQPTFGNPKVRNEQLTN